MIEWLRQRSFPTRVLLYAAAAIVAFAVAAGVGAIMALMIQGGTTPQRQGADADRSRQQVPAPQRSEDVEQRTTPRPQGVGVQQEDDASREDEAQYVSKVGDLQASSVEAFMASHQKISRYDALTAEDVEEMKSNQAALQDLTQQVANLDPPRRYGEQYEVYSSAVGELYEAARLAYNLAADPVSATQSEFDEYDRHVSDAAARLQRSNEILGRDYETLRDVQEVSPS